jgi:uncharacterized protein YndB with AHSA1/START domain
MAPAPVSVERVIAAPPATVFGILADPRRHPEIDGSGMLRSSVEGPPRLAGGARFSMAMRQLGLPYRVTNEVTEFEDDRLIAWRPWVRVAGRAVAGGVTWRYEVSPEGDGSLVVETYDLSTAPTGRALAALGFAGRMEKAMTVTLERLADVAEATARS